MPASTQTEVLVRPATPADAATCGRICYDAFSAINARHNFPCDFPNVEHAIGVLTMMFSAPGFHAVVAEVEGRIIGSNVLDERSIIMGIGPITVDPATQNSGVGRKLMQAVIDRAHFQSAAGIRLVQAASHNRSLSLYASLGFDVREPLSCVQGTPRTRTIAGCEVRPAVASDPAACNALSTQIHGFDRGVDLAQSIEHGTARVVERGGRITGYASNLAFFGHATCESNQDLKALLASADTYGGPGILIPNRNTELLRWCLSNGLRITQPLTLMTTGLYNEPRGAWYPSVLF
ncbi:GNAT family N-acetyltransferase [Occallatibacter riparius]|uniref:GNAT family N-acetyltransferase n=1 Tax=Occallatibacter riparius TaxID=1002689 RepID=A0A9J7BKL3_9BACT|nr:GNAT family N-acetyltransferase [Occallatibacter riparius]UWZ83368.1 GNAT family N-acetyltransferase [Occallatibacter riparius]